MKVTIEQLAMMDNIARTINDYEKARAMFAETGVTARTTFNTDNEKLIALRCRAAMYNPNDKGMDGKLNEIAKRVKASKSPMPWHSFAARTPNIADQTIKVDGVTYALEHKSGAGDWYKTHCETLEKAMEEYTKRKKILVWDTDEFTLVIPFSKLIEGLNGYNGRGKAKGWQTFFKKTLSMASDGTAYVVGIQEWKTSKLKIKYLQDLAEENAEWFELVKDMIF